MPGPVSTQAIQQAMRKVASKTPVKPAMNKGGVGTKFKPCKGCPTPAKCKAAGKCLKKKMAMGGTTTDMMPPNYGPQQKQQQVGGSMTPGMMNRGGMGKKKKAAPKGPAIMIAIAMPPKKGAKRATGTRKK